MPLHDDEPEGPRIEIQIGDDDFLSPKFIEIVRNTPIREQNTKLVFPNGYIFIGGQLHVWTCRADFVSVNVHTHPGEPVLHTVEASHDPSWIYVRHTMNSTIVLRNMINGPEVRNLQWDGWNEKMMARYCKMEVKTATANGSTLHPTKSRSVIYAKRSQRAKR